MGAIDQIAMMSGQMAVVVPLHFELSERAPCTPSLVKFRRGFDWKTDSDSKSLPVRYDAVEKRREAGPEELLQDQAPFRAPSLKMNLELGVAVTLLLFTACAKCWC